MQFFHRSAGFLVLALSRANRDLKSTSGYPSGATFSRRSACHIGTFSVQKTDIFARGKGMTVGCVRKDFPLMISVKGHCGLNGVGLGIFMSKKDSSMKVSWSLLLQRCEEIGQCWDATVSIDDLFLRQVLIVAYPAKSQNTKTLTWPTDGVTLTIRGGASPGALQAIDGTLVSGL